MPRNEVRKRAANQCGYDERRVGMLAIEIGIFVFAALLVVAFAILVNPPTSLVNFFGGKRRDKDGGKPK